MAFSALLLFHGTPSWSMNVNSLSRYFSSRLRRASAASERKDCARQRLEELVHVPLVLLQVPTLEAVLVDGRRRPPAGAFRRAG